MQLDPLATRNEVASLKLVTFGLHQALQALAASLVFYGFTLALAFSLSRVYVSDAVCLAITHLGGVIGLLAFWRFGRWGRARFDSFGAALLLVAVAFRFQAMIDAMFFGTRVKDIFAYRSVPVPEDIFLLFLKGEVITVVGLILVACAWRLGVGASVERYSFLLNSRSVPLKMAAFVYLASLCVDISRRVLGLEFGALSQIMSLLFVFGVAAIYFIATQARSKFWQVVAAAGMALPMTALALNSGMKEEMFFPMIPAALLFWLGYRSYLARGFAVALTVAVLAVSQLYVHYVRDISWRGDGDIKMSPLELIRGFSANVGSIDPADAFDSVSSRVNMTVAHAITVTLADRNGFEPINVFGMIPASFVPRIFWPGKPVMQPGVMHTARILGISTSLAEIRSATAAGFATELYLGGWWIGVVLGALTYGFLLAFAQRWALRVTPGFGHLSLCFVVGYWTLRFDEKHIVYAYTSIVFCVVFLLLLTKAARAFGLRPVSG